MKQSRGVTHFQCHAIFPSEFSVLPQKSSAYLRADSPSDANSQNTRDFLKTLNIKDLYSRHIFSPCKKHCFSMRLSPYQGLKCLISHPKRDRIGGWNRHNRNARRTVRDYVTGYMKRRYGMKEPSSYMIWHLLTSVLQFYFVKKKSRKIVSWSWEFSLKTLILGVSDNSERMSHFFNSDLSVATTWIYCYAGRCSVTFHKPCNVRNFYFSPWWFTNKNSIR